MAAEFGWELNESRFRRIFYRFEKSERAARQGSRSMALDDEDDNWEEQIKQTLRYSVRLMIKHPGIDPAQITKALGLVPNQSHVVGLFV
jgi:hypothetical protein